MRARATSPRQLVQNAATGPLRIAVSAVLALAITPYALRVLGVERYGVWALAGAVFAALQLSDLGLSRAMVRSVASAIGRDDLALAAEVLAAGRAAMLLLALVVCAPVWLARHWIALTVFHVPSRLAGEAAYVIGGTAVVAALQLAVTPFQAGLDGVGRMDATNLIDAVQRLASSLGVVLVLALGWGLPGLVWKNVATTTAAGVAYWWALRRQAPALHCSRRPLSRRRLADLLRFGGHVQATNAASALLEPATKTVLARLAGLETVALFELAWRVMSSIASALMTAISALFPAAATLQATSDDQLTQQRLLGQLYARTVNILGWTVVPLYALVAGLSRPFVERWLGPEFGAVASAMAILAFGWLVAILSLPAFLLAQATGRERLSTVSSFVTVGGALAGVFFLTPRHGLIGAAIGLAFGLLIGAAAILALFSTPQGAWRARLPLPAPALAVGASAGAIAWLAQRWLGNSWPALLAAAVAGVAPALAAMGRAGLVPRIPWPRRTTPSSGPEDSRLGGWPCDWWP